MKTGLKRAVDGGITVAMNGLNGSLRLGMKHSSLLREPHVTEEGYVKYLTEEKLSFLEFRWYSVNTPYGFFIGLFIL